MYNDVSILICIHVYIYVNEHKEYRTKPKWTSFRGVVYSSQVGVLLTNSFAMYPSIISVRNDAIFCKVPQ